jgi:hypothetical protein
MSKEYNTHWRLGPPLPIFGVEHGVIVKRQKKEGQMTKKGLPCPLAVETGNPK